MSEQKTSWIIELVERVTGPMKGIMNAYGKTESVVDRVSAAMGNMSDSGREAANKLLNDHKELQSMIAHTESRIDQNTNALKQWDATDPMRKELEVDVDNAVNDLREYKQWINKIEHDLDELAKQPDSDKIKRSWGDIAMAANQTWEVTQKVMDSMSGLTDIADLRVNIQRATDMTGTALDTATEKTHNLSRVYKEDSVEIMRAANTMSKQMQMSYGEALKYIEAGFQKGANLNGDMLDQIKEYSPQLREAGMSAAEGIALMAHAGKEGIFSDKALDSIKEAGTSLRELGQPQIDALKGIGIEVKELAGKTAFEAAQMISKAMDGATVQAKQSVVSDIFKGAGEDAGLSFIEGLGGMNLDPNNMESVQEAGAGMKGWLASMESSFANTFGNIAVYAQEFGGVAQWISAGIPVFQALTKATWFQNIATKALAVAQRLMNTAFLSSPIGWIVAGLTAVTMGIKYAWDHFEGFRAVLYGLWETFKQVFENIKGLFSAVFAPIAEALQAFENKNWGDVAKAVLKMNPVSTAQRFAEYVGDGGLTKGLKSEYNKGHEKGVQSFRNDQEKKESVEGFGFAPAHASPTLDGKITASSNNLGSANSKSNYGLDIVGSTAHNNGSYTSNRISNISETTGRRNITVNMTVNNKFEKVNSSFDIKKVAEEVVNEITAALDNGTLNLGL